MALNFSEIPTNSRIPAVYIHVDNSKALASTIVPNPHKALILGQRTSEGSVPEKELTQITRDGDAGSYFGNGSQLARMINVFRQNNPNMELYAIALDDEAGDATSWVVDFGSAFTEPLAKNSRYQIMIDGEIITVQLAAGLTKANTALAVATAISSVVTLPVTAVQGAILTETVEITAKNAGESSDHIDIRTYSLPDTFSAAPVITPTLSTAVNPTIDSTVWDIIKNTQIQHFVQPYQDDTSLAAIETELESRWTPEIDLKGYCYSGARDTFANLGVATGARNSAYNSIIGAYDSPSSPWLWASALAGVASKALQADPARPLHFLQLRGIVPPSDQSRFTRAERNSLLYRGITPFDVDASGYPILDAVITTYQEAAPGVEDVSYLYANTMFQLMFMSDAIKNRIKIRFLVTRFKLSNDDFPVPAGAPIVIPKTMRAEIISIATILRDDFAVIEDLDFFIENLRVERDPVDRDRINVLVVPDLINQFRRLAVKIMFIL